MGDLEIASLRSIAKDCFASLAMTSWYKRGMAWDRERTELVSYSLR